MTNLPDNWTNQDIGDVSTPGSASYDSDTGTFTVEASGEDIWDERDEFHYVYRPWGGDGSIVARVESLEDTHEWAKAGVMIRESLSDDSKHALMCVTPGNGASFQRRTSTGGSSASTTTEDGTAAPHWVKLVRDGDTLTGYISGDGSGWTEVDSVDISMASDLYVGLAVTSHDDGTVATATMDELTTSAGSVRVSAGGETIPSDGAATFSLDAEFVETVTIRDLWTDWTVTVDDPAGAAIDDRVSDAGELELGWDTPQGAVSPSITVDPPADTYVGGTYAIDVVAEGDGDSATDTAILDIQSEDPPAMAESVSQYGITWEFENERPVGQYANGDWWVKGPVSITTITPESTEVDGRVMNGTMVDAVGSAQGYDSYEGSSVDSPSDSYQESLNRHPSRTGGPLTLDSGTVFSSISIPDDEIGDKGRPTLQDIALLTVVEEEPSEDAFRPGPYSEETTAHWTEADLDYSVLQSLPVPDSAPDLAALTADVERFWNEQNTGWTKRPITPLNNQPSGYGRGISYTLGDALLSLHLDYSEEQKRELFVKLVQRGLDIYDRASLGGVWTDNCGHNHGRKMPMLFAGLALDDTDIIEMAGADGPREEFVFQEDRQTFIVSDEDIENPDNTDERSDEAAGETDGSGGASGTLERQPVDPETHPPIVPGTIEFEVGDDLETITDDGDGNLTGSESATGWIDYDDGSWEIEDSVADESLEVDYEYSVTYKEADRGTPEWACKYTARNGRANSTWEGASYRWVGSGFMHHALAAHLIDGAVEAWNHQPFFEYVDRYVDKGGVGSMGGTNGIQPFAMDLWEEHRDTGPGDTMYVDFADGDDTADGRSPDTAWKHSPGDPNATGNPADVELGPGDTIKFKGGVAYQGSLTLESSGDPDHPITLDANTDGQFGEGRAILDGGTVIEDWQPVESSEDVGGNPDWEDIIYADIDVDISSNVEHGEFVKHRKEPPDDRAPWQRVILTDGDDGLLPISQSPKPSDPFYPDLPGDFYESPRELDKTYPYEFYYEEGTIGNSNLPLEGITSTDRAAPVIEPLDGGAVTFELDERTEIAEIGIVEYFEGDRAVEELAFLADGEELTTVTPANEAGEMQQFELPETVQTGKLTFELRHSDEEQGDEWTRVDHFAAFTPDGDNLIEVEELKSILTDGENLDADDPDSYEGEFIGVHGGNYHVYFARVQEYRPADSELVLPEFEPETYEETRYAFYNAGRLIDNPGEWAIESLDDDSSRIYLLPESADGEPDNVGYPVEGTAVSVEDGASHIAVRGFLVQRYAGGDGGVNIDSDSVDVTVADCEIRFVSGSAAIGTDHASSVTIENNEIHHNPGWTVGTFLNRTDDFTLRGNHLDKNTGTGIRKYECKHGVVDGNNLIRHNGLHAGGMSTYEGCEDIRFENNYIRGSNVNINRNAAHLTYRNNVIDGMNDTSGLLRIYRSGSVGGTDVENLTFEHNTFVREDRDSWTAGILGQSGASTPTGMDINHNVLYSISGQLEGEFEDNIYLDEPAEEYMNETNLVLDDLDELFVDPENGDLRRAEGGPKMDAGADLAPPEEKEPTGEEP